MRTFSMIVAMLLVAALSSAALAADTEARLFLDDCIYQRIQNCEREAGAVSSPQDQIRYDARVSAMQAQYFQTFRETLVNKMISDGVSLKKPAVDHYMIRAFYELAEHSEMAMDSPLRGASPAIR